MQISANACAGTSDLDSDYPVMVALGGSTLTRLSFSSAGVSETVVTDFPTTSSITLLACAENGGELAIAYRTDGVAHLWSSAVGDRSLGSLGCDDQCFGWFDEDAVLHLFFGALPRATSCATHCWRSQEGDWTTYRFSDALPGETISDSWFDIERLKDLKFVVTTEEADNSGSAVRYLEFENGVWNTSTVATAGPGMHFDHVSTGSQAGGSQLIVYRQTSDELASAKRWFYAQAGGIPPSTSADVIRILLGGQSFTAAADLNGDGIADAADIPLGLSGL